MRLRRRPEQVAESEWMDAPGHSLAAIEQNLGDLRRVNRLLGGVRLTLAPLQRLAAYVPAEQPLRVLDVATGGADIPRAISRWGRRAGRRVFLVASDVNPDFIRLARRQGREAGELVYVAADARRLPFAEGAFHVVTSSLALHHMLPAEARQMLRESQRCASVGVVINDIVRGWLGYFGAFVATRLGSRSALTWHDGPLSVRRAFTPDEMADLARDAGLRPVRWDRFLLYRVALTAIPKASPAAGSSATADADWAAPEVVPLRTAA